MSLLFVISCFLLTLSKRVVPVLLSLIAAGSEINFLVYKSRRNKRTDHRLAAGHEPVCFVHAEMIPSSLQPLFPS